MTSLETDLFDVAVLGAGSAGQNIATAVAKQGRRVALVEANRVGGECEYVACIPSKSLLRSAQARHEAAHLTGVGAATVNPNLDLDSDAYAAAVGRRDRLSHYRIDTAAAAEAVHCGISLIRGKGHVVAPGVISVNGRRLRYVDLVIATGSVPSIPDIEGLEGVPTWTSDEALSEPMLPGSLLVLGGGAVGCEAAQLYARFGVRVVLVEPNLQLLGPEQPDVAARLADVLRESGVDVRLGCRPQRFEPSPTGAHVRLSDGSRIEVQRVFLATGRKPTTHGLGLERLGIDAREALDIDHHGRVKGTDSVWAAGDVTGKDPYTHTASYLARIVAANLLGGDERADMRAIPRVVYTDPPVASVGLDEQHARDAGVDPVVASADLGDVPRNNTDGTSGGLLVLTADRHRGVLIGAAAIGPAVDHWLGEAVLAIRAELPLKVLADVVHAFPTMATAYEPLTQNLAAHCEQA